eukprot:TRINITY_DN4830_c0_g1_i1.p1 TRINITY_DN4830_c0_g1~~TRINITY_DN4830_c0_g1_i1.p1  ORF type:complete len:337 (+),score=102.64 TRINITY_DN4830_c0_g1_i1:65-1075(+)
MEEILLVSSTLELIHQKKSVIENNTDRLNENDVRTMIFNLVDFQNNFVYQAFGMIDDALDEMKESLKKAWFYEMLLDYQLLVQHDEGDVDLNGGCYFVVGSGSWKKSGLEGDVPGLFVFSWLKTLFTFFQVLLESADADERDVVRSLVTCWYYIASELEYQNDEVEPVNPEDNQLETDLLTDFAQTLLDLGSFELEHQGFGLEADFEEISEEDMYIPEGVNIGDNDLYQDDDDFDYESLVEPPLEDTEAEKEVRDQILSVVEECYAFMPNPETQYVWFERVLSKAMYPDEQLERWFPWSVPPIQKMAELATSEDIDPKSQTFMLKSIKFMIQQDEE